MASQYLLKWSGAGFWLNKTVRVVIEQFAKGIITLPEVPKDTKKSVLRYAPGFVRDDHKIHYDRQDKAYSIESLANFLKWTHPSGQPKRRLVNAVNALELIELGILKESQISAPLAANNHDEGHFKHVTKFL